MELRCPVEEAIGQLEYGVRALEQAFGEIAHLRENQAKLAAKLETYRGRILKMDFLDAFGEDKTAVGLLIHCLTGFWNPGVKHFYSDEEREKWGLRSPFVLPGAGGVMTWGGALQRICIPLEGGYGDVDGVAAFYDRDGRDAFNWNEHDDHDPWFYLVGI
ncbi:MAG: hypothetical protein EOP88_26425 [Verrucomicrobiaceae bacterium]|nr:MAG: hypothetical protein EOP88_26425 [Verrucomicrobiaceae bacterium]